MAQRIIRTIDDLHGKVYQRPSVADLGIWVGRSPPPEGERITFEQYLAGVPGYWGFLNLTGTLVVLAGGAALPLTGGIPAVEVARWLIPIVMPSGAPFDLRGGVPSVSVVVPGYEPAGGASFALTGGVPTVAVLNKIVQMVAAAAMPLTGGQPTVTKFSNLILNGGFESALGAEWTINTPSQGSRVGVDGGVTPPVGSWQLKLVNQSLPGGSSLFAEQSITGAQYRAAIGDVRVRFNPSATYATTDVDHCVRLAVLAYDAGDVLLGHYISFFFAGARNYGSGGVADDNASQRAAVTAGTWYTKSFNVKTAFEASVGAGNVATIARVRFMLRNDTGLNVAGTTYWDDFIFV